MVHFIRLLALMGLLCSTARSLAGEGLSRAPSPDDDRLDVSRVWSDGGGRITSQTTVGGRKVLQGVQLIVGENNWLKEVAVYNLGILEQRTQFYPSGRAFLEQRREHNGSGSETVYLPGPIKAHEIICQGEVKGDRRWSGGFLEAVPEAFARKWMLREYREGKVVSSVEFPMAKLMLPAGHADVEHWLWEIPDWPATGLVEAAGAARSVQGPSQQEYRAYWLSRTDGKSEYPMVMVTRVPIAELPKRRQEFAPGDQPPNDKSMAPVLECIALTIATYERDSIWNDDLQPIKPLTGLGEVDQNAHTIKVRGILYRYEDGRLTDVVRLLKEPMGKEAISRLYRPLAGMDQTARALRLLLEEQLTGAQH